jgi:hypothetical protein
LLRLGIGFTDLCKSGAGMDHQISVRSDDIAVFRTKMLTYRPRTIAFTSKKAASLFYGRPTQAIGFGRQPPTDGFPRVFVLASPSGAASGHWTLQPWRELAEWMGADQPHHDSAAPDVAEDRRRLDAFKSNGQAVPFDDVKGWIASWDSMDELPRPSPRKII